MHHLPEWSEKFTEHLVDGETSATGAAGPRQVCHPEPRPEVESEKHISFTHFPGKKLRSVQKDENYMRSVLTCHVPKCLVGDLITADHTLLSEECELRQQSQVRGLRLQNNKEVSANRIEPSEGPLMRLLVSK